MDIHSFFGPHSENLDVNLYLPFAVFLLLVIILIWPPEEFVSAGATFEDVFSFYLGDPTKDVLHYNCRKIVSNRCCVAFIPSLFAMYLLGSFPNLVAYPILQAYIIASHTTAALAVAYFLKSHKENFINLTAMKELSQYENSLERLAAILTAEYIDFNNFSVSFAHSQKFTVSRSWAFNFTRYNFNIIPLGESRFEAVEAVTHNINLERPNDRIQYLRISGRNVVRRNVRAFTFRIRSDQLRDLQEKLAQPVDMMRSVILHQSLNEKFVQAFVDCILDNDKYVFSQLDELEPCFGCSVEQPNVKIIQRCQRFASTTHPCRQCNCRPMWCVACLARVFASKQKQDEPNTWLDGQATCPTCRAEFCVLDVSFVAASAPETSQAQNE